MKIEPRITIHLRFAGLASNRSATLAGPSIFLLHWQRKSIASGPNFWYAFVQKINGFYILICMFVCMSIGVCGQHTENGNWQKEQIQSSVFYQTKSDIDLINQNQYPPILPLYWNRNFEVFLENGFYDLLYSWSTYCSWVIFYLKNLQEIIRLTSVLSDEGTWIFEVTGLRNETIFSQWILKETTFQYKPFEISDKTFGYSVIMLTIDGLVWRALSTRWNKIVHRHKRKWVLVFISPDSPGRPHTQVVQLRTEETADWVELVRPLLPTSNFLMLELLYLTYLSHKFKKYLPL